ncbi:MAG TPA: hypothetical protein VGM03_01435 [Phycisphaerae bacterium]|jgi:hypothetical protein
MSEPQTVCEKCRAPARVHRSIQVNGVTSIRHLCLECADAEWMGSHGGAAGGSGLPDRVELGAVLTGVGALIAAASISAQVLAFGHSAGFGWRQMAGVGVAILLVLVAALFRSLTLVAIGVVLGLMCLVGDDLAFASAAHAVWQRAAGCLLGIVLLLVGGILTRRNR